MANAFYLKEKASFFLEIFKCVYFQKDPEAKGIRDILINHQIILILVPLAEVLIPINVFYKFLQTHNLNYSLVMGIYQQEVSKFETIP